MRMMYSRRVGLKSRATSLPSSKHKVVAEAREQETRALALTTHATEERAIPSRPDLAVRVLVGLREVKWVM
ncbi:hypothetical protein B0H11DRAFT_2214878 [Mycena galericulata]|nr:hypothetical protein B0H11DRAFT_2214878 [Mycena galericulata]